MLVDLFQPLGVKAEFLSHLNKLLRGLRIFNDAGQSPGSDGLVAVVIGLGHVSTFLDRYRLRKKGSITRLRISITRLRMADHAERAGSEDSNAAAGVFGTW